MIVCSEDGADDDEDSRAEESAECELLGERHAEVPEHGHGHGDDGSVCTT